MTLATVVLAGGAGRRISPVTGGRRPKALVDVAGRPFLDRKLAELAAQGVTEVVLLVGHQGGQIRDHLARGPSPGAGIAGIAGVARGARVPRVTCVDDGPELLGTGGAIVGALGLLPEAFFVTYGDTLLDQPMAAVEAAFRLCGAPALMTVVHNRDRGQPSNTSVSGGLVVAYAKGDPPGSHEYLDYGLLVFRRDVFAGYPAGRPADLGVMVRALVRQGRMAAMVVERAFHDVGTPEALAETAARYTGPALGGRAGRGY